MVNAPVDESKLQVTFSPQEPVSAEPSSACTANGTPTHKSTSAISTASSRFVVFISYSSSKQKCVHEGRTKNAVPLSPNNNLIGHTKQGLGRTFYIVCPYLMCIGIPMDSGYCLALSMYHILRENARGWGKFRPRCSCSGGPEGRYKRKRSLQSPVGRPLKKYYMKT